MEKDKTMGKITRMVAAFIGILVGLVLMPQVVHARIETEEIGRFNLDRPAIDFAMSADEDLIFVLTDRAVVVYSISGNRVETRIPVDGLFDRITYNYRDNTLFLSSSQSGTFKVVRIDKLFDIDISGLPVKGPATAPVTIAVFNDYQ